MSAEQSSVCVRCRSIVEARAKFCPHCGAPMPPKRVDPIEPGQTLSVESWGKAVVGERVGSGGMGVVHRGWLYYDPAGPRAGTAPHPVAIKVLHPLLRGRQRARDQFVAEAKALARLSHPNVVHFFAFVDEAGLTALVIELVEGQPLNRVIEQHAQSTATHGIPCMPFMRAWHYFAQLLGALAAIHQLGIVHRDVKPANVLVRTDGVVKLTDFGIARLPADEALQTGGLAPGTAPYMAPEQVMAGDIDGRADSYAAAIVLYEMLSGKTPFDAPDRNDMQIRRAQLDEAPPPLTSLVPQAPPVLDAIFARALAKHPGHRFASAIEFGEALRTGLNLPESPGWDALTRLANKARAISRIQAAPGGAVPPGGQAADAESISQEEANALRTGAMAAFRT